MLRWLKKVIWKALVEVRTKMFDKKSDSLKSEGGFSIIAQETFVSGNIKTRGSLRIDGKIEGHITLAKQVVLGEGGEIHGSVEAESVIVGGKIYGNARAKKTLRVLNHGFVQGDIRCLSLHIEEGATFEGTCTMKESGAEINVSRTSLKINPSTPSELFDSTRVLTPLLK